MAYLIYCFTKVPPQNWPDLPTGINNQPVTLLPVGAVGAVCSTSPHEQDLSDFAPVLLHQEIVDAVFAHNPVVPVRFGSQMETREDLISHLTTFAGHYEKQLSAIRGFVEIGIRVLLQTVNDDVSQPEQTNRLQNNASDSLHSPGIAYLRSRRRVYVGETQRDAAINHLLSDFKASFKGLFHKVKLEKSFRQIALTYNRETNRQPPGEKHNSLVSFYFLVKKEQLKHFAAVFRELIRQSSHKLMLTGPWPPYNFVDPPASDSMTSLLDLQSLPDR